MDIQWLWNTSVRSVTAYVTKYAFKSQKNETKDILNLGIHAKAIQGVANLPDWADLTPAQRGSKVLNKILHNLTAPKEIGLTMAALF